MSPSAFTHGPEQVRTEPVVGTDGESYGGEVYQRASFFTIGNEYDGEQVVGKLLIYNVFTPEGEQVHAQRLVIVDADGHEAVLDTAPAVFEHIGEWLFQQASMLRAGEPR